MDKITLVIGNKNYSSWSLRAWLLLKEMHIEFDEVLLKLNTDDFEQRIGHLSPSRRVPVLHLGSQVIWDTLSIAEFLNEKYPDKQVWPKDLGARILARSISAEMHSSFNAIRNQMPMNCRAQNRTVPITKELQVDIDRIIQIWSMCRSKYTELGPWLFGGFSMADAMYAPVAFRFKSYQVDLVGQAKEYSDFLLSRPAMQHWLQDAHNEKEFIDSEEVGL